LRRVATGAAPKGRAAARRGEANSAPRTRARPAELPHVEGAEQDKKALVITAAALRADDQPPSAPELRVVGSRAHRDTGLFFSLLCAAAACVVVGRAFDRRTREGAATSASRQAAQDLGQRRIGIVSMRPAALERRVFGVFTVS